MEQDDLVVKIASILEKLEIPYAVTGGIAVSVWGHPRFTADIDIAVELLPEKLEELARELLKIDKTVYVDELMMRRALEQKGEFNFIHPASGLKVDFWILKGDSFDRAEMKGKVNKEFSGRNVSFISPEDLILRKLLWYKMSESTRQLEDIKTVLERQKKLDMKYIKKWAKTHSTSKTLEKLLND
ncbi:MAG: nucleotidyl transferase AbiEii/AbiGii toxin family protein [bacterium]|nr:nucleotidyl transferase AbiEii/AbiGii toxin family protein [bacterium]